MVAQDETGARPNTPTRLISSVVSSSSAPRAALPQPPTPPRQQHGSASTVYYPPPTDPPTQPLVPSPPPYDSHSADAHVPYREPVGLPNSPTGSIPDLIEATSNDWPVTQNGEYSAWDTGSKDAAYNTWGAGQPSWETPTDYSGWNHATATEMSGIEMTTVQWWDKSAVEDAQNRKPGPGALPPLVGQQLHGAVHFQYKVTVTAPDLKPDDVPRARSSSRATSQAPSSSSTTSSLPPSLPPELAPHAAPSVEEALTAVPHPYAQYCIDDFDWTYHQVKSSVHLPPMVSLPAGYSIPDQTARKVRPSCIHPDDIELNTHQVKSHHFHHYPESVKGSSLSPPFVRKHWRKRKAHERKISSATTPSSMDVSSLEDSDDEIMLDLWVCCLCSTHVLSSGDKTALPSVFGKDLMSRFIQQYRNPPVGKTWQEAAYLAGDTIIRIVENFLWKRNPQSVKVGSGLIGKVGWNKDVQEVFSSVGFEFIPTPSTTEQLGRLSPPNLEESNPDSSFLRSRLLRGWLEFSVLVAGLKQRHGDQFRDHDPPHRIWVSVEHTGDEILRQVGAHHTQITPISRSILSQIPSEYAKYWERLGTNANTHSGEIVQYAYERQIYCDPLNLPAYFEAVHQILKWASSIRHSSHEKLEELVAIESSKGRWSTSDMGDACNMLGLTAPFPEPYDVKSGLKDAWLKKIKELNARFSAGAIDKRAFDDQKRDLKTAYRIMSESSGGVEEVNACEATLKLYADGMFDVDGAYATLEVPKELDDEMIITIYGMRVDDQPLASDRMRSALLIIAEDRDSERLKTLALTGTDSGPPAPESSRMDWPRGLQQLGNTCYLNSLLQYFYTIKDLRAAIAASAERETSVPLSDDEIKQDRVGGRLVTRREVERSKKFVLLLRDLFWQLECSQDAAIKPEIELAKLALVTSKDEEDEAKSEGSDATNSSSVQSGSTLVEEPMAMGPLPELPPPILGKQTVVASELDRRHSTMDVDGTQYAGSRDDFVMVEPPRRATIPLIPEDSDVQMADASSSAAPQPPALPPRKKVEPVNEGSMMFGKQHDVSECMDNCMFQIEAALKFGSGKSGLGSEQTRSSVVKDLFYGKLRQRIEVASEGGRDPSVHEKEDLFSQLLVNVADEGFDLYDGLMGRFNDSVEFEGKQGQMETSIVELPPLLQIQLQRVQFNRETLEAYKSNAYVKFDESLYLDRFLSSANAAKKAKTKELHRRLDACRERLLTLTKSPGSSFERALSNTFELLAQQTLVPMDMSILEGLETEGQRLKDEIQELRHTTTALKTELEQLWADERNVEYELSSVFIHRGSSPSFGHYFFYGRDLPDNPDRWLKYNDQDVSTINKAEVFADTTGSTANPYLLVYVRKGSNAMKTIHRTNFEDLIMGDS